jgi:hypothetical protein
MAKKMTLSGYLAQRGTKAKALTRGEAALLGIPYPLQAGWPRRYGASQIDEVMLEKLIMCATAARRAAREKAQRAQATALISAAPQQELKFARTTVAAMPVCGFVLRRARRYLER